MGVFLKVAPIDQGASQFFDHRDPVMARALSRRTLDI